MAAIGRRPTAAWVSLAARLVMFVAVVGGLSRTYGPPAGLAVLVAAVLTRGMLARKRLANSR